MRTPIVLALLSGFAAVQPLSAQKTEDEARLVFTSSLAYTVGTDLWSVQDQPVLVVPTGFELINISRDISSSLGLMFSGAYYPKPGLGFVGELFFTGIGVEDKCSIASPTPTQRTQQICASIDGASKSSSAVLISVGPVLRAGANQVISPYLRAQVGVLVSNLSPITTTGTVTYNNPDTGQDESLQVVVYSDPSSTRVTAGFVFGGGFTFALGKGWQLRSEVRDNLVQVATVAGPTTPGDDTPAVVNRWRNLWSLVIGADIVLEKKRGHRY